MKSFQELRRVRATSKRRSSKPPSTQLEKQIEKKAQELAKVAQQSTALLLTIDVPEYVHPDLAAKVVDRAMEILEKKGLRSPSIILNCRSEGV